MTRRQRNFTFWILAFSLILIPLVAQGEGPAAPGAAPAVDKPQAGPGAGKKPVVAKPGAAKGRGKAATKAVVPERKRNVIAPEITALKTDEPVPLPEEQAPPPPTPEAPKLPAYRGRASLDKIRGFNAKREGDEAILYGQIPNECVEHFKPHHVAEVSCAKVKTDVEHAVAGSAKIKTSAWEFPDADGSLAACIDKYQDVKEFPCSRIGCTAVETLPGARMNLADLSTGRVMLLRHDADVATYDGNLCEDFTTTLTFSTKGDIAAVKDAEAARADKIGRLRERAGCINKASDMPLARRACVDLVRIFHAYSTVEDCAAEFSHDDKEKGFALAKLKKLKERAAKPGDEEPEDIAKEIATWVKDHPKSCKQMFPSFNALVRSMTMKKRVRKDEGNPSELQAKRINDAIALLDTTNEEAPCLDDNNKMTDLRRTLQERHLQLTGQMEGLQSDAYLTERGELLEEIMAEIDTCTSNEMDTACSSPYRDMQGIFAVDNLVYASNVKSQNVHALLGQQAGFQQGGGSPFSQFGLGGAFMPIGSSIYGPSFNMGYGGTMGYMGQPLGFGSPMGYGTGLRGF